MLSWSRTLKSSYQKLIALAENMSDNNRPDVLEGNIVRLLDEINIEAKAERRDTAALGLLEQSVAEKRQALIRKREHLAKLESKVSLLLAAKAVASRDA